MNTHKGFINPLWPVIFMALLIGIGGSYWLTRNSTFRTDFAESSTETISTTTASNIVEQWVLSDLCKIKQGSFLALSKEDSSRALQYLVSCDGMQQAPRFYVIGVEDSGAGVYFWEDIAANSFVRETTSANIFEFNPVELIDVDKDGRDEIVYTLETGRGTKMILLYHFARGFDQMYGISGTFGCTAPVGEQCSSLVLESTKIQTPDQADPKQTLDNADPKEMQVFVDFLKKEIAKQ